ncbi:MAG: FKBP-type peptidyl-prolyl cis-trans isomerase [Bacteroidales bacterium]|nr:MAG: FKBP-type peptidyl-prolyl cis-trans isomerase [Bacteroidales bacterium]
MIPFKSILLVLMIVVGSGCSDGNQDPVTQKRNPEKEKESLVKVNKYLLEKDKDIIENYVDRRGWEMDISEAGLWYMIYEEGKGPKVNEEDFVTIGYSISLLDGTICYDSDESGPKQFRVGAGGVEAGLEEGIRLLREGDKARFILPPHLAYGLIGDENKIPARSVIVYDLEVLDVSRE